MIWEWSGSYKNIPQDKGCSENKMDSSVNTIKCEKSASCNCYMLLNDDDLFIFFYLLTTEGCPLNSLSIVGGGEVFGIATVISYMAGTNERMLLTADTKP